MSEKNKVTVRIAGNEYVISGAASPEYIQKIALFVDKRLQEITRKNHLLSTSMASVLTAVNLTDEMFRLNETLNKTEFELSGLQKKYEVLKEENERLKSDYAKLKEREAQLHIELTRSETEVKEARNTINTLSNAKKIEE